ncbi:dual specificity protein phosphatase family protein [Candidatus Riflebacteria bacterium]
MSENAILITQCLQNDFVKPLGRYHKLPNLLHIGHDEALRLMGESPGSGPVAFTMKWAQVQSPEKLKIIHIRDWHNPDDPFQEEHFRQFGSHCIKGTKGADFAFPVPDSSRQIHIINSPGLNDFVGTDLFEILKPFEGKPVKVGLMGVWTEAKISFLAYDLRTRFPQMQIGVCSALTASSSRAHHFLALEQLERLIGVMVFSSIGEFTMFLSGSTLDLPLPKPSKADWPELTFENVEEISETDRKLLLYLFRDCKKVNAKELTGGFSGNMVLGTESVDIMGQPQVSYVVKIGPQGPIGQERTSFEKIEGVLGNNAPRITDFADTGGRGALKYRYAAMGGGFSSTFQKIYCTGAPLEKVEYYLRTIFVEQLGRFYTAATLENVNLLEYYWFKPDYASRTKEKIEEVLCARAEDETLLLPTGQSFPNPYYFYKRDLPELLDEGMGSSYFSYIHGDLNGANIIIDAHDNVWLIDFFHTHRGHVLKDLIKLENDLLYIFTSVSNEVELLEALALTHFLLMVEDLGRPLPHLEATKLTIPQMRRAYECIRIMRSFYPALVQEDRNTIQLLIAQLRYSMHSITFEECNDWQKKWALYASGFIASEISKKMRERDKLRIDWIDKKYTAPGLLGMTILPGRKDYERSLSEDIKVMQLEEVTHVVPLLTLNEFILYGVDGLMNAYHDAGFNLHYLPIMDQRVPSLEEMQKMIDWLKQELEGGAKIMVHCVGGLGRSGLVVACFLRASGLSVEAAIKEVRRVRSPRAIESRVQEYFIQHSF